MENIEEINLTEPEEYERQIAELSENYKFVSTNWNELKKYLLKTAGQVSMFEEGKLEALSEMIDKMNELENRTR